MSEKTKQKNPARVRFIEDVQAGLSAACLRMLLFDGRRPQEVDPAEFARVLPKVTSAVNEFMKPGGRISDAMELGELMEAERAVLEKERKSAREFSELRESALGG